MKLIVGLGNLGAQYVRTRHNVGFRVCETLHKDFQLQKKLHAAVARRDGVLLCKPQTMMNNSGEAVRAIMKQFRIAPKNILVIYDDKDLPFGRLRMRTLGSSGGHKGVQSIMDHLGTPDFARLRIGIATTRPMKDTARFVLRNFSKAEEKKLPEILAAAQDVVAVFIAEAHLPHADIDIE